MTAEQREEPKYVSEESHLARGSRRRSRHVDHEKSQAHPRAARACCRAGQVYAAESLVNCLLRCFLGTTPPLSCGESAWGWRDGCWEGGWPWSAGRQVL